MRLFIPWRLFFNANSRQPATHRQAWLEYFRFADSGVELTPEIVFPESKSPKKKLLSERARIVLSAIAEPKRPKLLH